MWPDGPRAPVIAGIGATEFSRNSGRTEWALATEAVLAATRDAGVATTEIDGFVTMTVDTNPEVAIARAVGAGPLTFLSRVPYGGGGAAALVLQAALAVASGQAEVVVCYRAINGRSGLRFGSGKLSGNAETTTDALRYSWVSPVGLRSPASWVALFARRYLTRYGLDDEAFAPVALSSRRYAARNPRAYF